MSWTRRKRTVLALLVVVLFVSVTGLFISRHSRIMAEHKRGRDLIGQIRDSPPPNVKDAAWQSAWMWTDMAFLETFSPYNRDPSVMKRLNDELELKLTQPLTFDTWDWVWAELQGATAAGARYNESFFWLYKEDVATLSK